MNIPEGLLYTKDHEWVKIDGPRARIGITDFAQHALGDITYVDTPKQGMALEQFKLCATVESVKAASDVYAPLSGSVLAANEELATHPEYVNHSPYDMGWLAEIAPLDLNERANLMTAAQYKKYLEEKTQ
jgi:glycine cleavage system H protein